MSGLPADRVSDADDALLEAGHVTLTVDGPLATVALVRPDVRNAQTPSTWAALARVPGLLPADVRIVLVRGIGRSFSAGLDRAALTDGSLAAVADGSDDQVAARIADFQAAFGWLSDPGLLSIAAVQGHAIGAGMQLALACSLIVAAEDAQFALAEVTLGLVPDLGGLHRLVRSVGEQRALELAVTGRRVDAAEALRIGLVHSVVPVVELRAHTARLVEQILANDPTAVREVTRLVIGASERSADDQNALDRAAQVPLLRRLLSGGSTLTP